MASLKMVKVKCANCGKELEVPEQVKGELVVCNSACYDGLEDKIYQADFCADRDWECLSQSEKEEK